MNERNYEAVWKVYDGMKRFTDTVPDEVTYTSMIKACAAQKLIAKVAPPTAPPGHTATAVPPSLPVA